MHSASLHTWLKKAENHLNLEVETPSAMQWYYEIDTISENGRTNSQVTG
jgi:hypothetical protein